MEPEDKSSSQIPLRITLVPIIHADTKPGKSWALDMCHQMKVGPLGAEPKTLLQIPTCGHIKVRIVRGTGQPGLVGGNIPARPSVSSYPTPSPSIKSWPARVLSAGSFLPSGSFQKSDRPNKGPVLMETASPAFSQQPSAASTDTMGPAVITLHPRLS